MLCPDADRPRNRYLGKNGKATNDLKAAAVDPKSGAPVDNPARNIWVTETAVTTALNTAYFAEGVATFATRARRRGGQGHQARHLPPAGGHRQTHGSHRAIVEVTHPRF